MDIFNKKKLEEADKKLKRMSFLINEKNAEINRQYNSIIRLEDNYSRLMNDNQKLIDWILKILDTVGTMEVREKTQIKIPVMIEKEYRAFDCNYLGIHKRETITIPEIKIVKIG